MQDNGYPTKLSLDEFEAQLKMLFGKYFTKEYIDENLLFTDDFKEYCMAMTVAQLYSDWIAWENMDGILDYTKSFCEVFEDDFFERKKNGTPFKTDKMWLQIGWISDKHEYVFCCDKSSEYFGCFFDIHDDHPWLNESFYYQSKYDSIKDYFEESVSEHEKEEEENKHLDDFLAKQDLSGEVNVLELLKKFNDEQKQIR